MRKLLVFIALSWMFVSALETQQAAPIRARLLKWYVLMRLTRRFPMIALLMNRFSFFKMLSEMFQQTGSHHSTHRTTHKVKAHHKPIHHRKMRAHNHIVH